MIEIHGETEKRAEIELKWKLEPRQHRMTPLSISQHEVDGL